MQTTLLHLAVGLIAPAAGTITVLGGRPANDPAQLGRVGFVAQDTPVYPRLTVAAHLRMGACLNPAWDASMAASRIEQLGLDLRQRAGALVLAASRVRIARGVSELLASHHRLSGPRRERAALPAGQEVIEESHTDRRARCWCARRIRSSTRPGPSGLSRWKTWCWPT